MSGLLNFTKAEKTLKFTKFDIETVLIPKQCIQHI